MSWIKITDGCTGTPMYIRADLMFKLNEYVSDTDLKLTRIEFTNGSIEYAVESIDDIIKMLGNKHE